MEHIAEIIHLVILFTGIKKGSIMVETERTKSKEEWTKIKELLKKRGLTLIEPKLKWTKYGKVNQW